MERLNNNNCNNILRNEHEDRYIFVSNLVQGVVLDLACGIGYGSRELNKFSGMTHYTGVDVSSEAIKYARLNYSDNKTVFFEADGLNIEFDNESFDVILSFETLEHIENYEDMVTRFASWLKPNGLLIGSVPNASFEAGCDRVYGKNPYHLIRFDEHKLSSTLTKHFKNIELFTNELAIGSLYRSLTNESSTGTFNFNERSFKNRINGSILFFASNAKLNLQIDENTFFPSFSLLEYDELKVLPQSKMVAERDVCIKAIESMVDERDTYIKKLESMVDERDTYIKKLESMVNG